MSTSTDVLRSVFPARSRSGDFALSRNANLSKHRKSSSRDADIIRDATERKRQPNQTWDIVISYLTLGNWTLERARNETEAPADIRAAIAALPRKSVTTSYSSAGSLTDWYMQEIQRHFSSNIKPALTRIWGKYIQCDEAQTTLQETCDLLHTVHEMYRLIATNHLFAASPDTASMYPRRGSIPMRISARNVIQLDELQMAINHVSLHSLPLDRFSKTLSYVMFDLTQDIFQLNGGLANRKRSEVSSLSEQSRDFLTLMRSLQAVGLGGNLAQQAFAEAMDQLLDSFVNSHWMKVDWSTRKSVVGKLWRWIEDGVTPFAQSVVEILQAGPDVRRVTYDAVTEWTTKATERLGTTRVKHLFDFVVRWPESTGAILDLKEYTTTPQARAYLTSKFIQQINRRLLHPGATTTQILDIYISIIRAFTELDAKGVLLDRVARPIRKYLKTRDDTAKIIVASLITIDGDEAHRSSQYGLSVEIAKEMRKPITGSETYHGDLDWENMDWTPDPIDADPDFKAKSEDILSSLLSLFDREDFINELKTILGDHFLRNLDATEHLRETKLLELFKHRLGDDKLQACEVMLNDVQVSKRMTEALIHTTHFKKVKEAARRNLHSSPDLDVQVLSSYFWPSLQDETFKVPAPVQLLSDEYARLFEVAKDMRKLHWLSALGRVDVELQLSDRNISESVPTWVASVIYAFNSDDDSTSVTRTAIELVEQLEMDEALVQNGLLFWIGKQVLTESSSSPKTYTVLETLASQDAATEAEAAAAAAAAEADAAVVGGVKAQDDVFAENEPLYEQFILGMLTNQGSMPSMKVWMLLKMVFPGGFTFELDKVQGLLAKMVDAGRVVSQGDMYGIKK